MQRPDSFARAACPYHLPTLHQHAGKVQGRGTCGSTKVVRSALAEAASSQLANHWQSQVDKFRQGCICNVTCTAADSSPLLWSCLVTAHPRWKPRYLTYTCWDMLPRRPLAAPAAAPPRVSRAALCANLSRHSGGVPVDSRLHHIVHHATLPAMNQGHRLRKSTAHFCCSSLKL